jgi:hypothetical protein
MNLREISIHPKFAGVLDALVNLLFLYAFTAVGSTLSLVFWFLARVFLWAVLIRCAYYPDTIKRFWHLLVLVLFGFGISFLLLFIEWRPSWYVISFIFILFPLVSFFLLPTREVKLSFEIKPYRRWRFWLSAFGLFGIWSGAYAMLFLQIIDINKFLILFFCAALSTACARWWWKEYNIETSRKTKIWTACMLLFMVEISWVAYMWPLGYFSTALVVMWFWYVVWLLARFHLLPAGINWKKQTAFFITNGLLFAIFLFFIARWK